jgi:hypothetical protein
VNTVDIVNETKRIAGVTCLVFRDLVFEGGLIHEATDDWYAAVGTILEVENTGEVVQLVKCNFDSRCVGLPTP